MDGTYGHLSLEERCTIAQLQEAGQSRRAIAAALERAASTVSLELSRNRAAGWSSGRRCWSGEARALTGAGGGAAGAPVLSAESIYRFIYA